MRLMSVPWGAAPGGRMSSGHAPTQNWVLTGGQLGVAFALGAAEPPAGRVAGLGVLRHRMGPAETPGARGAVPSTGKGGKIVSPIPLRRTSSSPLQTPSGASPHPSQHVSPTPSQRVPPTPCSTHLPRCRCPPRRYAASRCRLLCCPV